MVDRRSNLDQEGRRVSICWWLSPTGEQFRIQARAYVVPPMSMKASFPAFPVAKGLAPTQSFDWEAERLRIFDKLSDDLQASFLRPACGSVWTKGASKAWPVSLERNEEFRHLALENFALIVLDPLSVDLVRLKTRPHERFVWTRNSNDEWDETELVP